LRARIPTLAVLGAVGLTACGIDHPDVATPAAPAARIEKPQLLVPSLDASRISTPSDVRVLESRRLAPILSQLYFFSWAGTQPLPDAVILRAVGGQPVSIEKIVVRDDPNSPFGIGAAQHFTWTANPGGWIVEPGAPVEIEVRFLADVLEMKTAILEIRSNAENAPVLRVGLTGKVIAP
jgi:hypothetical protein